MLKQILLLLFITIAINAKRTIFWPPLIEEPINPGVIDGLVGEGVSGCKIGTIGCHPIKEAVFKCVYGRIGCEPDQMRISSV